MAQYQHLPIYKATYDLLVQVTEVTRHFPRDFKTFATRIREEVMDVVLLIYRANSSRRTLATAQRKLQGSLTNPAQTLNSYLGLLRHTNGWRQRQHLAHRAQAQGLRVNPSLTKCTAPSAAPSAR